MKSVTVSRIRLAALAALFVLIGAYQFRNSWAVFQFLTDPGAYPRLPIGFSQRNFRVRFVAPDEADSGIQRGDRVLAINGRALKGTASLSQALAGHRAGDNVNITVEHDGHEFNTVVTLVPRRMQRSTAPPPPAPQGAEGPRTERPAEKGAEPRPGQGPPGKGGRKGPPAGPARFQFALSTGERLLLFTTNLLTVWIGFGLGFFVAWRRPADRLAWLLLGMLLGFGQMAASSEVQFFAGWHTPWNILATFYNRFISAAWPAFMVWFALDFPDPHLSRRFLGWTRWPVTLAVVALGLVQALSESVSIVSIDAAAPLFRWAEPLGASSFWATTVALLLFFANLGYKQSVEAAPDLRRRLRMLFIGANVSLVPIFILIVASRFLGVEDFSRWSIWIWMAPFLLLFLFPLTLAYVILVERAMEVGVVIRQGLQYALATRGMRALQIALTAVVLVISFEMASNPDLRRPIRMQIVAYSVMAIFLLRRVADKTRGWIDRRFFREQVHTEQVLAELTQEVRNIADTPSLLETVSTRISAALHVPRVEVKLNGASAGEESGIELALPMQAGGRRVGWLRLGPKHGEAPYTGADRRLLESVATQTALAIENQRLAKQVAHEEAERALIRRELEIAWQVQERLFPQRKPAVSGIDYAGRCRPAQSVGGDSYDYFVLPDGLFCFAVGDVSGKGIPASLVMASVQASMRGLVLGGTRDLSEMMRRLNEMTDEVTVKSRFATLFFGQLDPATGRLVYASAGHNPAILVHATGDVESLAIRGIALGLSSHSTYPVGETRVEPGDILVVYSDGITEARNLAQDEFNEERLVECVLSARQRPAAEILDAVFDAADRFAEGAPQHDDMTAIVVRRVGNAG